LAFEMIIFNVYRYYHIINIIIYNTIDYIKRKTAGNNKYLKIFVITNTYNKTQAIKIVVHSRKKDFLPHPSNNEKKGLLIWNLKSRKQQWPTLIALSRPTNIYYDMWCYTYISNVIT